MASEGERGAELLRADKEQLDRAATLLGGDDPGFVIVACGKDLVGAALGYLQEKAGVEVPEPVVLRGSEAALEALAEVVPELEAGKVRSLALGGEAKEALRALNWHREKLLKGAPVVLWVEGVEGLTEMREAAPDAYSFRDMVVLVRGDGGRGPTIPHKESRSILEARRRLARARTPIERAEANERLSGELRVRGYLTEAENVAKRGLGNLPEDKYTSNTARIARARLWTTAAMAAGERGLQSRQRTAAQNGMNEIKDLRSDQAQEALAWLLIAIPGPISERDRQSSERALSLARNCQFRPDSQSNVIRSATRIATGVGNITRGRQLLTELEPLGLSPINASLLRVDLAIVEYDTGRLLDAEPYFQQSISIRKKEAVIDAIVAASFVKYWLTRGELDVADRVVQKLPASESIYFARRHELLSELALARGEVDQALENAILELRESARSGLDRQHLRACKMLAEVATKTIDASRIADNILSRIAAELDVAEDISRAITDNDPPPWYPISFLRFRAEVLIRTDQQAQALTLARRALDLSRTTCPDLIPQTGRALADHLLRTGNPTEALPLLAEIEPEAVSRGMLKELSRIRADRVLALVLLQDPPSAIEPALTSLREALESTGAPRIKAETLQELAIRLPPATTLPDPLTLATETHTLFVEMPMPAKEARSLELAGDVLAARGKPAEAKRRYLMAQGILERRGLGLRLPLLARKISAIA